MKAVILCIPLLALLLASCMIIPSSFPEKADKIIDTYLENQVNNPDSPPTDNLNSTFNSTGLERFMQGISSRVEKKSRLSYMMAEDMMQTASAMQENDTEESEEELQQMAEESALQPSGYSGINQMLSVMAAAYDQESNEGKTTDEAMRGIKQEIDEILSKEGATIGELLNAAELTQMTGINEKEVYAKAMEKINSSLSGMLKDTDLSMFELLEIASVCQELGFDGLAEAALQRVKKARMYGSEAELKIESLSKNHKQQITINVMGDLKAQSVLGYTDENSVSYYFRRGKIKWNYYDKSEDECSVRTIMSAGEARLKTQLDGQFTVYGNNEYEGCIVSKQIPMSVLTDRKDAADEGCNYIDEGSDKEDVFINLCIKGAVGKDEKRISGSEQEDIMEYDEEQEEDAKIGSKTTTWSLKIPVI